MTRNLYLCSDWSVLYLFGITYLADANYLFLALVFHDVIFSSLSGRLEYISLALFLVLVLVFVFRFIFFLNQNYLSPVLWLAINIYLRALVKEKISTHALDGQIYCHRRSSWSSISSGALVDQNYLFPCSAWSKQARLSPLL